MIYGEFSTDFSSSISSDFFHLKDTIGWKSAMHFSESREAFEVGAFSDTRLPYKKEDFFFYDDTRETFVAFWGNIYNKSDLAAKISDSATLSNPQLVSRLFFKEGPRFVTALNGDFAIAVYQKKKNSLFLFRDHLGIVPMAYSIRNQSIIFSTDVFSLCTFQAGEENFQTDALLGDFKVVDNHSTCNKDVVKVLPGHFVEFNGLGVNITKYWTPEDIKTNKALTFHQAVSDLGSLLRDSIKIRSDKRLNAGTHMSGGLDSSLTGVLARKCYPEQKPFYGFSWSPINPEVNKAAFDERGLVEEICIQNDLLPVFFEITLKDLISIIKSPEKIFPSVWEEKVIQMAREKNIHLLFSGWGGQEFISYEDQGIDIELFRSLRWSSFLKRNPVSNPIRFIKSFISNVFLPGLGLLSPGTSKAFFNHSKYLKSPYKKGFRQSIKKYHLAKTRRKKHLAILENGDIPVRTERWAVIGAKSGIEYRYPLLDKRIVEYMLSVPTKILLRKNQTRVLFRELSKGFLPEKARLRESTIDPVLFSAFFQLLENYSIHYRSDLKEMESNPAMNFVDYEMLEKDLALLDKEKESAFSIRIHETMFSLNLIHHYTKNHYFNKTFRISKNQH